VQINVSTGPDPAAGVAVPNVTRRTLEEARQALDAAGFEVLALSPGGDAVKNSSSVASQTPAGGATIPSGSLVVLYV
jgi:beta-lactam-binding protein with PASTA domain